MKPYLLLMGFLMFFSLAGDGPGGTLTQEQKDQAIHIQDVNQRFVLLGPGESATYFVEDKDTYLEVENLSTPLPKVAALMSFRPNQAWTVTQTCGINVYISGINVAVLRNRANVTYTPSTASAPARFNWYDMNGTQTYVVGFSWANLHQSSSPATGVTFSSAGWVQAGGTLNKCILGACGPQEYYSSLMIVNTSGTFCQ